MATVYETSNVISHRSKFISGLRPDPNPDLGFWGPHYAREIGHNLDEQSMATVGKVRAYQRGLYIITIHLTLLLYKDTGLIDLQLRGKLARESTNTVRICGIGASYPAGVAGTIAIPMTLSDTLYLDRDDYVYVHMTGIGTTVGDAIVHEGMFNVTRVYAY